MTKASPIWLLATFFLTTVSLAGAQQPGKVYRIGTLEQSSPSGREHLWHRSVKVYESSAMLKERTRCWISDGQTGTPACYPVSQPNLFGKE